jgi:hypothetical protein
MDAMQTVKEKMLTLPIINIKASGKASLDIKKRFKKTRDRLENSRPGAGSAVFAVLAFAG